MDEKKLTLDVMDRGAVYCDIRKERWYSTVLNLKDGVPETIIQGEEEGAMTRVLYGNGWGYVGTADMSSLESAMDRAFMMAKNSDPLRKQKTGLAHVDPQHSKVIMPMKEDFRDISPEEKLDFLRDIEGHLKCDFVKSTDIRYRDTLVKKEIITGDGTHVEMEIPRTVTYMIITGKSDTVQMAVHGVGGTGGFEMSRSTYDHVDTVKDMLKNLLKAKSPPSGKLPVVMDPHLTGVFSHEAFGHAAEGDLVASGNSCLKGKIGEKVASDMVTIKDDPTMDGYGTFPFDDEGTKAKNRILVKDGVLNDFILDRENAWKLGMEPNGGARAEDFRVKPLVRMSNTILEPGDMHFEELIEGIDRGIYAKSTSGGQVSPAQGTFQFNAQVAFLIENGEITRPLRNVSFNGFTLETLQKIVGVSKDFETGVGHCGKGQSAPVTDGGANVLISQVTVGGRE